jgi:hypothetical protein
LTADEGSDDTAEAGSGVEGSTEVFLPHPSETKCTNISTQMAKGRLSL